MAIKNVPDTATTIKHKSAQAKCWRDGAVFHVDYTGLLTDDVLASIGPQVAELAGDDLVMIRFDKAVMLWPEELKLSHGFCHGEHGVFVVRPEHCETARGLSQMLVRQHKIVRIVFADSQIDDALDYVNLRAMLCEARRKGVRIVLA